MGEIDHQESSSYKEARSSPEKDQWTQAMQFVKKELFRALVAMSTQQNLELHHIDLTIAFLNGVLEEEVYMKQPEGYTKPGEEHLICKLSRVFMDSSSLHTTTLHAHLVKM